MNTFDAPAKKNGHSNGKSTKLAAATTAAGGGLDHRHLLSALRAFKRGDFSVRMPLNLTGVDGEIAQAFNDVVELEEAKAAEIARVADQVGKEGRIGQRMSLPGAGGGWAEVIESMNTLVADMAYPVTEVARVIGSVAKGDLSQTMVLEVDGRPLRGEALRRR